MTKQAIFEQYLEYYEYHGNTTIERIRKQGEITVLHDWIIFDSVEEATEFFYSECGI
jgi:hypothetical protein